MPMQKNLEKIHHDLQQILKESRSLSQNKHYSSDEVQSLQERLQRIDAQYKEGIIDDRDKQDANDDPYQHDGQAQVADDLYKVHQTLSEMLDRAE